MTITTTLNAIKAHNPCASGWATLLKSLNKNDPDDAPLPLSHVLQSNGLYEAIWALRTLDESHRKMINLLAYRFADLARPYMKDQRSIDALNVTYRFINGEATIDEIRAAAHAAHAADVARAAYAAAARAAHAAYAAAHAAYAAADVAHAAHAAYAAAARAAYAAYAAADVADVARAAIRKDMEHIFLEFVE